MKNLQLHRLAALAACFLFSSMSLLASEREEIQIWPGALPAGSVQLDQDQIAKLRSEQTDERIKFVDRATLTIYPAPAKTANGCAVVICPGGGYNILAWPKEGRPLLGLSRSRPNATGTDLAPQGRASSLVAAAVALV